MIGCRMALWMESGSESRVYGEVVYFEAVSVVKRHGDTEGKRIINIARWEKTLFRCYCFRVMLSNQLYIQTQPRLNFLHLLSRMDAEEEIELCSTEVKTLCRAVKSSMSFKQVG